MAEWDVVSVRVQCWAMRGQLHDRGDGDAFVRQLRAGESELPGRAVDDVERVHGRGSLCAERDASVRGRGDADVHDVVHVGQLHVHASEPDGGVRMRWRDADADVYERGVGELERVSAELWRVGGVLRE